MTTVAWIRFVKQIKQADLAMATGIHQSRLSLFEHGYALPSDAQRLKIAKALNVKADELTFELKNGGLETDK